MHPRSGRRTFAKEAERALNEGALGISFSFEYVSGIGEREIVPLMRLASRYNVPVYFHARYADMEEPGTNLDATSPIHRSPPFPNTRHFPSFRQPNRP